MKDFSKNCRAYIVLGLVFSFFATNVMTAPIIPTSKPNFKKTRNPTRNPSRNPASVSQIRRPSKPIQFSDVGVVSVGRGTGTETNSSTATNTSTDKSASGNSVLNGLIEGLKSSISAAKGGPKSTGGATGGTGAGGSQSGPSNSSVGFDPSAKKSNDDGTKVGGDSTGGHDNKPPPGGGNGEPPPQIEIYDRFWPMCIFVDPSVKNANAIVKGLVDRAANECKVNLMVFPVYIKAGYPTEGEALKNLARGKCNAVSGMQKLGVNRASAAVLVNNDRIAASMCQAEGGNPRDNAACGELGYDSSPSLRFRLASIGQYGGTAGVGRTAVSIIGPSQQTVAGVASVVQGRNQMAAPPGYGRGMGVGNDDEGYAGSQARPEVGWQGNACDAMRKNSFPNTNGIARYNKNQKDYILAGDASRFYDLKSNPPLWAEPKTPQGGQAQQQNGGGGGGGSAQGGGEKPSSNASTGGAGGDSAGGSASVASGGVSGGHKKPNGGAAKSLDLFSGGGVTSVRDGSGGRKNGGSIYAGGASGDGNETAQNDGSSASGGGSAQVIQPGKNSTRAKGDQVIGFDETAKQKNLKSLGAINPNAGTSSNGGPGSGNGLNPVTQTTTPTVTSNPDANKGLPSIISQAKAGSSILNDDFFKKLKTIAEETGPRRRKPGEGATRLSSGGRTTNIYQSSGGSAASETANREASSENSTETSN